MVREIPRIIHQARILLQFRVATHKRLKILFSRLRKGWRNTQRAGQRGGRDDRADLHVFSPVGP